MPHCNITITIPTNLFERIEKVKDKMDVSYVCEHSLNAAVTTEECKLGILSKREAAIARLKVEAWNECNKWSRKGQREGLELASDLSFVELQQIMDWYETQYSEDGNPIHLVKVLPEGNFLVAAIDLTKCPPYAANSYLSGIILGVMEFWNSIQDEIEGD